MNLKPNILVISSDLIKIAFTALIALSCGYLFHEIGIPAPYLMGSLFGVWGFGTIIKPLRERLGVAGWIQRPVVLGLAVLVGGNFNHNLLALIPHMASTLISMIIATIIATLCGLWYLVKIRNYSPPLALLSCLPGGQAEIILISHSYTDKVHVVAIFHLIRVSLVFSIVPIFLAFQGGEGAVAASNASLSNMTSLFYLDANTLIIFVLLAITGYYLGRLLRLPMPHLLGPLILSAIAHMFDFVAIPRMSEFVILAQVVIGGSIGTKLAQAPFMELLSHVGDALVNSLLVLSVYGAIAYILSITLGLDVTKMLLSFIPGGIYEVTLLALLFGFDVAFITIHHTVRVLLIFFALPTIMRFAGKIKV